jgi:3-oxoacyl-[acyl-carrier-protein] synthase II
VTTTVAVTGVGAITALGATASATWEGLLRGERGFREISLFDASDHRSKLVAEIDGLAPCDPATSSRTAELALLASREAMSDAALPAGLRIGLVVGGTTAGMLETESLLAVLLGPAGVDPAAREKALRQMLNHPLSAATDRLARELGPFARTRTLSSACSSGANAILVGATWLELGLVDAVVCGASDALCRVTLAGFNALGAIDPEGARPFDVKRRGLTLGEGAGFVVLERAEDAARRGKHAVCTLLGWAARAEAHHITNPEPTGSAPARAMIGALARAGLSPADVDYVNAHGTGTPLNDPMEAKALARVFGAEIERIPVSSVKGAIGHTLAAAGAIETVITALAIARGRIPPTAGLSEPDPACPLVHVTHAETRAVRAAITSSFGFGGMDTVLVLGAADRVAKGARGPRGVAITGRAAITPQAAADVVALAEDELDAPKARRLDRASRLTTVACKRALGGGSPERATDTGLVLGSAFGALDATSAFMRRLVEKGARLVSPAEFPNLVPSSPAGHVSIYHGLGGPTFVVADLSTSGECAFVQGWELVAAGEVDRTCVAAAEEKSAIVDAVLSVIFAQQGADAMNGRKEGAAALVLEAEERASGEILARVVWTTAWATGKPEIPAPTAPTGRALVVMANPSVRAVSIVDESPWRTQRRVVCDRGYGTHEAMGAVAIVRGVDAIVAGECDEVLFVGSDRGWGYAGILRR